MSNAPAAYGMRDYSASNPSIQPSLQQSYYSSRQTPPRTPSPTPSDIEELRKPVVDLKSLLNPKRFVKKKNIPWTIALLVILVLVVLMSIYHRQIVDWLTPLSNKLRKLPGGWIVPIAILFIISFPPLFGHEIVAVLCGVVWGLWIGFLIVAAGTFLGEIGNFYAFRSICTSQSRKLEQNSLAYACLARIVRGGGFLIALVARYSAIPGHFTTAVFSTCGMGIIVFSLAAFLSLPKQLITVYLGVIIRNSNNGNESNKSRIISDTVLVISFLITVAAAIWLHAQMAKAKPEVLHEKRRARARKEWEMRGGGAYGQSVQHLTSSSRIDVDSESVFNPTDSDENYRSTGNMPYGGTPHASTHALNPISVQPQRWDTYGRAVPSIDSRRQDSADVVQWDPHGDGGTTLGTPAVKGARAIPPLEGPSQNTPKSYSPPSGPYNDPYTGPPPTSSITTAQRQASPPESSGPSTPYYSPRTQSPPSQPAIPASVPRYQLHDGPSPANVSLNNPHDTQLEAPVPRIPPPPGPPLT